jgi:hypothetical protein
MARLVERINRNSDEKRLTSAVFLDTKWVKGLLYNLTILNFPYFLEKNKFSYLHS